MKIRASTKLQGQLHRALGQYFETPALKPPTTVYSSECHEKLSPELITDATVLLAVYLGMYGSSGSDFDLYQLNKAYLLDPAMRAAINALIKDWEPWHVVH